MTDLVQFLDSLILSNNLLDKKYKDGVPGVVANMVIGDGSPDEAEGATSNLKRRKSKKMKPDRKGLYPGENSFLRRWWSNFIIDSEPGVPAGSREDIAKKGTAQLRIRETQLQMIVILETLALQPLAKSQTDYNGELPFTSPKDTPNDEVATMRSKLKKSQDLVALLDVHVDRLCIWQSVVAEEGPAPGLVKEPRDALESRRLTEARTGASDILREFCIEVILPL
jgi:DNA replication regulator SLD3